MTRLPQDRPEELRREEVEGPGSGLADVTERLMGEFSGQWSLDVISALVCQAARDLAGTGAGPWGELLERSARQRLVDLDAARRPPLAAVGPGRRSSTG